MSCRLVCTSSRLYLLRLPYILVNPVPASVIVPNRIIHTIEIAILGCRHLDFAMPNIPLHKPHHTRLILPRSQVQHARSAVVVFPVEAEAGAFARERFAKGRIGIAVHAFPGEESAKGVPAAVIGQFLRDAAATIMVLSSFAASYAQLFAYPSLFVNPAI